MGVCFYGIDNDGAGELAKKGGNYTVKGNFLRILYEDGQNFTKLLIFFVQDPSAPDYCNYFTLRISFLF